LICPCKVNVGGRDLIIKALIIIDICSTLGGIVQIDDATSKQVAMRFGNGWLARYPKPI
jgi:hypothetical protein